ncbi:hypothetical protein [Bizionia arctica]|uniref:Uncharacterized protein n=1 Tax=Bizionia arctica TaxID=1495645 RepID=A0A917GHJ6_9FLAO|nr:hypothetical protein [Bizionia arctica]GGG46655.1 hypothetical protein GCM10010976_17640 [Bizionia arctica]
MTNKMLEHIKFILIDAINDNIQGMYELNNSVKKYYPELETQNGTDFVCGKILSELIAENYVKVFKMTNPEFEKIETINNKIGLTIASDKTNWIEYENEWIYGIESVDLKKSVELENKLYEKIKTYGNTVYN